MLIALVAGARPNFIKIAPLARQLIGQDISYIIIHTGQHYDYKMSRLFFEQFNLRKPDYYLGVGSGTHAYQTAKAILGLEKVFNEIEPDLVMVVGDVNSTLAGALTAAKIGVPIAHVEAGLRSHDKTMPEEINRLLTDSISDLLFTPSMDANENLRREGIEDHKVHLVGNIMIDTLVEMMDKIEQTTILDDLELEQGTYIYITLHRPSNVDKREVMEKIAEALSEVSTTGVKMVFPIHPRTKKNIDEFNLLGRYKEIAGLKLIEPIGYSDSIALARASLVVLTDSGGLQEETTFLGVPCLTLRSNTERPITIKEGTNILLNEGPTMIPFEINKILHGGGKKGRVPKLWDGKTAERIITIVGESL